MSKEDDIRISNVRLFHHLIDGKRNDFCAYQCERNDFLGICAHQDSWKTKSNQDVHVVSRPDNITIQDQWRMNRFVSFGRKNNCFSFSLIHSHQPPFNPIRYRSQGMIKFRSTITRILDFFQQKTIIANKKTIRSNSGW